MPTALLITRDDLVRFTAANGNIDTDLFQQYINIAQDIDIQNMLGTRLLERIQADIVANTLIDPYLALLTKYIKPCLIHFAMARYLPNAAYTIANKGVFKHTSENAESVSKEEVDYLQQIELQTAMNYKERFVDFICFNSSVFPEYNSNSNGDIYPDSNTNFTGWVM